MRSRSRERAPAGPSSWPVFRPVFLARDDGAATAEFAVVLPAVLLVLAAAVGLLGVATDAIRLADAAGIAARATGRGDDALAAAAVDRLAPGATVAVSRGDLVCVRLKRSVALGPLTRAVPLSANSCAPEAGG